MAKPKKKEINFTKDSILTLMQEIYNELVEQRSTAIRIQNKMISFYLLDLALPACFPHRGAFFFLLSFHVMKLILDQLLCSWLISLMPEFPAFEDQETWLIYLGF